MSESEVNQQNACDAQDGVRQDQDQGKNNAGAKPANENGRMRANASDRECQNRKPTKVRDSGMHEYTPSRPNRKARNIMPANQVPARPTLHAVSSTVDATVYSPPPTTVPGAKRAKLRATQWPEYADQGERRGTNPAVQADGAKPPNTGVVWNYPAVKRPKRELPVSRRTGQATRRSAVHDRRGLPVWYDWAMEEHSITAGELRAWRENFLQCSVAECAALMRVPEQQVYRWESGRSPIPFAVWYMMHSLLQSPDVWLARCGFADLYVEYRDGEAYLRSASYPGVRFTHAQLCHYELAMKRLHALETERSELSAQLEALRAENADLRNMFARGHVTAELRDMSDRLRELLGRIGTADVHDLTAVLPRKTGAA